ncbi:MAG: hypothetical protein HPY83_12695 [Anaerolineae bacterium]|nr:hypothetical protein [Anaerolineae bacterium]
MGRAKAARSDVARRATPPRQGGYDQAMAVALGFYLFGHVTDLGATLASLELGLAVGQLLPGLAMRHGGLWALLAVKTLGAVGTAWALWQLRRRLLALAVTCVLALVLLYVASINVLEVIEVAAGLGG